MICVDRIERVSRAQISVDFRPSRACARHCNLAGGLIKPNNCTFWVRRPPFQSQKTRVAKHLARQYLSPRYSSHASLDTDQDGW